MKGTRFGAVGFGAALTRLDEVWRGQLEESAARSSLALTGRGTRCFSADPLKPPIYKRPSSLAVFRVPSTLHVLDTSFTTPCGASRPSTSRLSSRAAYLLQEVAPSTAQFQAGRRRPRGVFPVCVAFEPLSSPSTFLWVHRHAVHRLEGGLAVECTLLTSLCGGKSSGLRQETIVLSVTATFRLH